MRRLTFLLLATSTFAASASASASASGSFTSGNQLKKYMDEDDDVPSFLSGVYSGYITGVHDTGNGILFCSPRDATTGQVKAVVSKYLKANPELWSNPAEKIVIDALSIAWPCKKN